MKTTKDLIAFATYAAIFLLVGALLYFFAFWRPNAGRVDRLNQDIEAARADLVAASQLNEMRPQLEYDLERVRHELYQAQRDWERVSHNWHDGFQRFLPEAFNGVEIMDRTISIVQPHSHSLDIDIRESQPVMAANHYYGDAGNPLEGLWLTPVYITFTASYDGMIAIFNDFAHAGFDNRIVEFSLNRQNNWWDVTARVDILSRGPQGDSNGFNGGLQPPLEMPGDDYTHDNGYNYYQQGDDYGYYQPSDYAEQPYEPYEGGNNQHVNTALVGTWLLMEMEGVPLTEGVPYFIFNYDGSGTMLEREIFWSSSNGILSVCITHEWCGDGACAAPLPWEYVLDGYQLTITMEDETIILTRG